MDKSREKAIAAGEPRYEGKECKRCGGTLRYVINCDCVKCSRDRARTCQRKTKERVRLGRLQREAEGK